MATERAGAATFKGNALTLIGNEVKVGDKAPDFSVLGGDLSAITLANYQGKVKVFCLVPSLDTPVCDTEIRHFNKQAAGLGDSVEVLAVSVDLPFAQARWCGDTGSSNVTALSDHRDASLGVAYGALIKELRLLARAVFVVDASNIVRYVEYVKEVTEEPNYEAALDAARAAV